MFNDNNTDTADGRHDPEDKITDGERGGIDPSTIGNINTIRGSGAESTSMIGSVVGTGRPEAGCGNRVLVDPCGYRVALI